MPRTHRLTPGLLLLAAACGPRWADLVFDCETEPEVSLGDPELEALARALSDTLRPDARCARTITAVSDLRSAPHALGTTGPFDRHIVIEVLEGLRAEDAPTVLRHELLHAAAFAPFDPAAQLPEAFDAELLPADLLRAYDAWFDADTATPPDLLDDALAEEGYAFTCAAGAPLAQIVGVFLPPDDPRAAAFAACTQLQDTPRVPLPEARVLAAPVAQIPPPRGTPPYGETYTWLWGAWDGTLTIRRSRRTDGERHEGEVVYTGSRATPDTPEIEDADLPLAVGLEAYDAERVGRFQDRHGVPGDPHTPKRWGAWTVAAVSVDPNVDDLLAHGVFATDGARELWLGLGGPTPDELQFHVVGDRLMLAAITPDFVTLYDLSAAFDAP
ncbi:MAG: hypothetical protein KC656_23820 [Myxococcales bacterium]|nr:hypothetical protein [Myxococcales bacterium]